MAEVAGRLTREQRRLAEFLLRQRGLDPSRLPIPRRPDSSRAPLSLTQQRLWTSGQVAEGTSYGNVPMAFRIRGSLNVDWVGQALSLVVARHEILRTTYAIEDGQPVQRIHPPTAVSIPVEDLRAVALADREQRFHTRVAEESRRPFGLQTEMLFRATGFRLDEADWGLVMVTHHLATDGWGARLLLDELSSAYRALVDGRKPDLAPLPVQYGDYATWEVERLDGGELEAQRRHWLERLAGAPRQLRLPFDFPPNDSVATESVKVAFTRDLSEKLHKLSRAQGVTPYVTLLAGFNVLLHQYTDQNDIVVGTILSRRTRSETEPLIGNFGNNLLLRTPLDDDPSFAEVIDRTAATMRDALAHSDVPLEAVAQLAPIPAFHVMFILRDGYYAERLTLPGVSVEAVRAASGAATLDLSLDITDGSRGIEGYFEYRTGRFAHETMQRLATAFEDVVARIVQEPQARLGTLPQIQIERSVTAPERPRTAGEEPATPTEHALARMWREWLEVETVYRGDNFFDLGGDSLRAVYVLELAERELGYRFRPEDLSRLTLTDLAALSEGRSAASVVKEDESALAVRRVNPLELGDEIKSLFERERLPHLVGFFDRAYPGGVKEGMSSWVALDETGRVTGHIAMFPQRFTCNDSQYTGAIGANLVMDRRHRNLANAVSLVRAVIRDAESQGDVDFLFGDPNESGRAIMSSVGGFTDVGVLARFVLPVAQSGVLAPAVAAYLGLKLRRGRREPMEVERRSAAAFDVREIELPHGQSGVLRPVHSPELYRRRFPAYPTEGDAWYLFTRDSERVAAVLVRRLEAGHRAELSCMWRRPGVSLVPLLHPIVTDLRGAGVRRLQAFSLLASGLGRELRAAGFFRRERAGRFLALPCTPRGRSLLESGVDWEITNLDSDGGIDWAVTTLD
jgi:Condensation domain/Phosphopantetheine attachment site